MNLMINLIPIKKGGGQQVANNLFTQLLKKKDIKPLYVVTKDTYLHQRLESESLKEGSVYVVNDSLISRMLFRVFFFRPLVRKNRIDIVYTLFGPGLHHRKVISITGCAYSNLFFPEIDFWKGHSFFKRLKLKLIDRYRLKNTLKSNYIIFENESMQQRAVDLFKYPKKQTKLILPSISTYRTDGIADEFNSRLQIIDSSKFNILMLTGWHKNKNIEIVPHVLSHLKNMGVDDVNFIITVEEKHPYSLKLKKVANDLAVKNNIIFFDSVLPSQIPSLFSKINAVALFSLLESFSNNIIEAWYFKKPLFISDEEWSRSICKNAAIYVPRLDSKKIAEKIDNYLQDKMLQKEVIKRAEEIIKGYPNPREKVDLQLNLLKKIYESD